MKKTLLLLSLFCIGQINAQTWVTIPDANFVTYLQSIVPSAMHGDSLNTSSTLVTTTTHSINVYNKSISNLSGIQYFTSLTYLSCWQNSITSLPTLPNTLTYLDCNHNQLTSLPALPNTLIYLDCEANSLTSLPTLDTSLKTLECYGNLITSLPTLPNSLKTLLCAANALTSLPVLPASVTYLECHANSLTSLPILPDSLFHLQCNYNSITSLPTLPTKLSFLWCENNNISCFPILPNTLVDTFYFNISSNPYNCLPNYVSAMTAADLAKPLCAAGNSNGCAIAGIEQVKNNIQLLIYPNPTNGVFKITSNTTDKLTVDLYDVNGRHVFNTSVVGTVDIDANSLDNGIYTLTIKNSIGTTNKKLVVVR